MLPAGVEGSVFGPLGKIMPLCDEPQIPPLRLKPSVGMTNFMGSAAQDEKFHGRAPPGWHMVGDAMSREPTMASLR